MSEIVIELIKRQIEIEHCIAVTEHNNIVENVNTIGNVDSTYGSMQERDLATENDTARLVDFDEAEGLSVEGKTLLSEILQTFRSGEKIDS